MKKLKVPYLETLDVLDLSSVGFLMEKAQRESIDVINWEEYSYKPIVAFDIARSKVNLYIRYFVKGNSLKALYETDGSPVYQDSCVEFFMKRVNDPNYYNFEFTPLMVPCTIMHFALLIVPPPAGFRPAVQAAAGSRFLCARRCGTNWHQGPDNCRSCAVPHPCGAVLRPALPARGTADS